MVKRRISLFLFTTVIAVSSCPCVWAEEYYGHSETYSSVENYGDDRNSYSSQEPREEGPAENYGRKGTYNEAEQYNTQTQDWGDTVNYDNQPYYQPTDNNYNYENNGTGTIYKIGDEDEADTGENKKSGNTGNNEAEGTPIANDSYVEDYMKSLNFITKAQSDITDDELFELFYQEISEEWEDGEFEADAMFYDLDEDEMEIYLELLGVMKEAGKGETDICAVSLDSSWFGLGKTSSVYTKEELGIDNMADDQSTAINIMAEDIYYNTEIPDMTDNIIKAIINDNPTASYWMMGYNINIGVTFYEDKAVIKSIDIYVIPRKEYSANPDDKKNYRIDTDKTGVIVSSVKNAMKVVEGNRKAKDKKKLKAYKKYILDNIEYDEDLKAEDTPRDLIYIFDKDKETNPVYKGYAKAFWFLCRHSDFEDENFECRYILGNPYEFNETKELYTAIPPSKGYAWNVVTLDGSTYHTDLAWCDCKETDSYYMARACRQLDDGYDLFADGEATRWIVKNSKEKIKVTIDTEEKNEYNRYLKGVKKKNGTYQKETAMEEAETETEETIGKEILQETKEPQQETLEEITKELEISVFETETEAE